MRSTIYVQTQEEYDAWLKENQIATKKQDESEAVAVNDRSDEEFLAAYSSDLGVDRDTLDRIANN